MDNFAVGVMAKNGLVYEDLKKANPKIIVVSMSMAGQQGPEKAMRGFASTASAYAGLEGMVGYASDREGESAQTTGLLPFGLGDVTQAIQGAIGALVALHHRNRSGEGQFVDMSLNESTTASMGFPLLDYQLNGTVAGPQGTQHPAYFPHGFFPAEGEDRWLALSVRDENDWRALCKVMERADWLENASLCDTQERRSRAAEINAGIASWCVGRDAGDAAEQLCSAGIPAAPQLELAERDSHPAFSARDFTYWHSGGSFDPCQIYNTPWVLGRTPPKVQCHAPGLGEQNDYVYQKLLGMSKEKVIELQEAGVLV
jgi:crotonobetainyl-CoA:carnitine CoA-transferase CaiB-like acyl-CoA transferase